MESTESKMKRLTTIAKEAAELAHRFDLPILEFQKSLENIDFSDFDLILLADENNMTKTINQAIPDFDSQMKIALIIGPEGGFSNFERDTLVDRNAISVSLGNNIIPTEAASLYALGYLSLKNS